MPKSVETLARDVRSLREAFERFLGASQSPTPGDLISLETYCALRGLSKKTVQNDLCCRRARKHPEFRKLGCSYLTDLAALRRWYASGASTYHGDPEVEAALQRVL